MLCVLFESAKAPGLGYDGLPLYHLCWYRDIWVKVTAWMLYLQKTKTSRVRPDCRVFARQLSVTAADSVSTSDSRSRAVTSSARTHGTSSSSLVESDARRQHVHDELPMYSNLSCVPMSNQEREMTLGLIVVLLVWLVRWLPLKAPLQVNMY